MSFKPLLDFDYPLNTLLQSPASQQSSVTKRETALGSQGPSSIESERRKQVFKQEVRNKFRNTLKTSGQIRHILAQEASPSSLRESESKKACNSFNSQSTFMRESVALCEEKSC